MLSWWPRPTIHPMLGNTRHVPGSAGPGRPNQAPGRLAGEEAKSLAGRRAAFPRLWAPTQDSSALGTAASPLYQGLCQDLPLEGSGRGGLGYYQGTDPERNQEGGTPEMGAKESYWVGGTHRQSYLCTGGAGVDDEGGEKRHRSSLRPAGSRAREVPLQAFCSRPRRTRRVGSSHLSKGQFFFILAEVYKDISCARPM